MRRPASASWWSTRAGAAPAWARASSPRIVEAGQGAKPLRRVVGVDTFTPLAGAALLVLPGEQDIVAMAGELA